MPGRHYTTVLFDLDNTLCDYFGSSRLALTVAMEMVAERYPVVDLDRLRRDYFRVQREAQDLAGGPTLFAGLERQERFAAALAQHGVQDDTLSAALAALYEERLVAGLALFPEAQAVLDQLAPHFTLGLLTNGIGSMQRRKLEVLNIAQYFRMTVISEEAGFAKPDPRIFQRALNLAGVSPEAAIFVGDTLDLDVAGARAAGVTAVWINRRGREADPAQPTPDHVIADLLGLLPLLDLRVPVLGGADGS